MCGIAGLVTFSPAREDELRNAGQTMSDCLLHRGPDAGGIWTDPASGAALAHRRLSIIDLSAAGAQPMVSSSGHLVISYNGEVYNAGELRAELETKGVRFRGHSDTEVILEGCVHWGVEKTVSRLIGMFAFAIWDRRERTLWLARDRLGIKPLYWGQFGSLFLFGSELKALRAHGGWPVELDRDSMAAYLRFAYVPAPRSIYRGVQKLSPGCILRVGPDRIPHITRYWSLEEVVRDGLKNPFRGSDEEAEEALFSLLSDAVTRRIVSDVPLGAFLSGGIDSSTVVALMQSESARKIRTFSIGFSETGYNEAPYAKAVADHLGTDHTELYITPQEAQSVIPLLPDMYDEPFADSSQIPTFLVSQLTRKHVTVALSGDGGDELFCGYSRYFYAASLRPWLFSTPRPLRNVGSHLLRSFPDSVLDAFSSALPSTWRAAQLRAKVKKLADVLLLDEDETYLQLLSHWHDPNSLMKEGKEPPSLICDRSVRETVPNYIDRMQYLDTLTYLPDDILTKVDRASMAVSLEARVPLLDHRVVALAWRFPRHLRVRQGKGKWLLRRVLRRFVPDHLIDRPKMGFGVPIDHWLRGPLRDWAEDLLSVDALENTGLNPDLIRLRWKAHCEGKENWQYPLWTILMLQAWLARHA